MLEKCPILQIFWILAYFECHLALFEQHHDKTNKMTVRPVKTWLSLGIRPVWSESSLCAQWVAKDPSFLHADRELWSDWADAQADLSLRWAHVILLVLSWGGSFKTWQDLNCYVLKQNNGAISLMKEWNEIAENTTCIFLRILEGTKIKAQPL